MQFVNRLCNIQGIHQPGSSSMVGLFKELGPCRINNQSTGVDLNPSSWTNVANVYVPIIYSSILVY